MRYEKRTRWTRAMLVSVAAVILCPDHPASLHKEALDSMATMLEAKVFQLKTDLHATDSTGESMQVPTLEGRGWHSQNPNGVVVLKSGTRVEVTGIFNYAERGFFLELAKEDTGMQRQPITTRPRARIRIMVETPGNDPAGQQAEAMTLIARVLASTNP